MSRFLAFVLLDDPAMPDMLEVDEVLRARHPDLPSASPSVRGSWEKADSPLIRCGDEFVAVLSMPAPLPHDEAMWARAATFWPEAKAVAARHRGHIIVSMLDRSGQPLDAARGTTAVVGALIETMPECCGVVWAAQVARPADLWSKVAVTSFAPYPDYPCRLWYDILPFRSDAKIGVVTMGLSAFVGREIEFVSGKLDLPELFDKVEGLAVYLIEHGSVIKDGDTFGISESERIRVQHKNSEAFGGLPVLFCDDESKH